MTITAPIAALTQQDFLDLVERLVPPEWLATIRDIGPGYELLQAYAEIFARLSLAAERLGTNSFILIAKGGTKATGEVELFRAGPATIDTPMPGQSGSAASIVSGAPAGQMRVQGLTNMSAASVGNFLVITGAASPGNNGTFEIVTFTDVTSVDVTNAAAVIPDTNNGSISWQEVSRTVIVKAGTVVTTSRGGRDFVTVEDVTFQPPDTGPFTVDVEAVAEGYEWNVPGQVTAADGTVLEGEIDAIKTLVEDPELGDVTIQVRQLVATTGGEDNALAGLGRNRGIQQGRNEDDETYRARLGQLPDTISPDAFERTLDNLLRPFGATFDIIETFEITYQTAYDGPNTTIPGSLYNPNLFVYDDPDIDGVPFRNRWLDINDYRGGVIVVVDNIQPLRDTGMVYDDTVANVGALVSSVTGGQRAVGAFDVPSTLGFGALQGAWDGSDLQKQSLYAGLYATLQAIKPAGNTVAVELRGE